MSLGASGRDMMLDRKGALNMIVLITNQRLWLIKTVLSFTEDWYHRATPELKYGCCEHDLA